MRNKRNTNVLIESFPESGAPLTRSGCAQISAHKEQMRLITCLKHREKTDRKKVIVEHHRLIGF